MGAADPSPRLGRLPCCRAVSSGRLALAASARLAELPVCAAKPRRPARLLAPLRGRSGETQPPSRRRCFPQPYPLQEGWFAPLASAIRPSALGPARFNDHWLARGRRARGGGRAPPSPARSLRRGAGGRGRLLQRRCPSRRACPSILDGEGLRVLLIPSASCSQAANMLNFLINGPCVTTA